MVTRVEGVGAEAMEMKLEGSVGTVSVAGVKPVVVSVGVGDVTGASAPLSEGVDERDGV